MKVVGIAIMILALVGGILPQFTDCQSQGRSLTTNTGMIVPMKCHWTAIAEGVLAVPIFLVGGLIAFGKRKETRNSLGLIGTSLGVLGVLIPTSLIGVCANPSMLCNMLMRPTLILTGTLVAAASLYVLASSIRMVEMQPA